MVRRRQPQEEPIMKNSIPAAMAAAVMALGIGSGCTHTMSMPGTMMQSNIPLQQGGYVILNNGQPVSGSAKSKASMSPFGMKDDTEKSSRWRAAIDQALAQCPGADALVNITTDIKMKATSYLYYIRMEYETIVTGTPVKITK